MPGGQLLHVPGLVFEASPACSIPVRTNSHMPHWDSQMAFVASIIKTLDLAYVSDIDLLTRSGLDRFSRCSFGKNGSASKPNPNPIASQLDLLGGAHVQSMCGYESVHMCMSTCTCVERSKCKLPQSVLRILNYPTTNALLSRQINQGRPTRN